MHVDERLAEVDQGLEMQLQLQAQAGAGQAGDVDHGDETAALAESVESLGRPPIQNSVVWGRKGSDVFSFGSRLVGSREAAAVCLCLPRSSISDKLSVASNAGCEVFR